MSVVQGQRISAHTVQILCNAKVVHEGAAPNAEEEDFCDKPTKDDIAKDDLDLKLSFESRSMQITLASTDPRQKSALRT